MLPYRVAVSTMALPEGTHLPERDPSAPAPGTPIPSHYRWCFGCGSDHAAGLHLSITAGAGLSVHGEFVVGEHHQGAPGLAHGGVLATALDEVLGSLNWLLGKPAVTGRLDTSFRRPVPVGTTMTIAAAVLGVRGRRVYAHATGLLPDSSTAVSAEAVFVQVPLEHFLAHGAPEHLARAIEDRRNGGPAWRAGAEDVEVNP